MLRCLALLLWTSTTLAAQPRVLDSDWALELISAEPELVTPTGCCFDDKGRLFVIECHTHFPPDGYDGPKTDRIWLYDDTNGDQVVDRKRLFYEGGVASMNIVHLGDGSFAVATRSEVVRIGDSDGDDQADQREVLLRHETTAVYPHNGLGGLILGADGWLYVGQGENFGEPYQLIGVDGSKQVGGGEGGNVFRCRPDGTRVERVATGFWNPFGMCFDSSFRLWAVGNDPDAMPPNRLMRVVPGGDYGFQFRFGRAGIHPLQAWNGELPGTLPMAGGTGEAACGVIRHGSNLWVTSWGDNRIERHTLKPRGASWDSHGETVVQGDASFRPVAMAIAPDRSIYFTDWVDRSYNVHKKGRLWRLHRVAQASDQQRRLPPHTKLEQEAVGLRKNTQLAINQRLAAIDKSDPWVRQAAVFGLSLSDQLDSVRRDQATSSAQRVGLLLAWRWRELTDPGSLSVDQRSEWIRWGLQAESAEVVLTALRWATERGCQEELPQIRGLLNRRELSPRVFAATIASIAFLQTGSAARGKRDPAIEKLLIEFAGNADHAPRLRALAIRRIPSAAKMPTDEDLGKWIDEQPDRSFSREVVRLLAERQSKSALDQLSAVALDESFDLQTRADALAGLSRNAGQYSSTINKLSLPRQVETLRYEARRILNRKWKSEEPRPSKDDLEGWTKLIGDGGNVDAGRRVFYRTTCANCHRHSGRGARTGPDLTTLSGTMTRRRVLESILQPSKEVGPLYVPWKILTVDGAVLTGLKLDAPGVGTDLKFQGADGNVFSVALPDIEVQEPVDQSIMPSGLEDALTIAELRDLVAFLTSE